VLRSLELDGLPDVVGTPRLTRRKLQLERAAVTERVLDVNDAVDRRRGMIVVARGRRKKLMAP
jgi:hypothetical protein